MVRPANDEQQLLKVPRPQSTGALDMDDSPQSPVWSPLSKFCKDRLQDIDGRLPARIHKVDLKEALEIERPRIVSRNPRASSLCRATSKDSDQDGTVSRPHSRQSCAEQRRLSVDEKSMNLQKAVNYFHMVKETNEMTAPIRSSSKGSCRRHHSTPCLEKAGSRKNSKDSTQQQSRRGSREAEAQAALEAVASQEANDFTDPTPNPGKARARLLAALGMTMPGQERKSLLAMTAINAIASAGQIEKKEAKNGEIGGQIFRQRNSLLDRLKERRATIE